MPYSFNRYGWLTAPTEPVLDRMTDVPPPAPYASPVPGEPHPYWIGIPGAEWEMRPYVAPPVEDAHTVTRAQLWAQIKAHRDYLLDYGGTYAAGKWFHSDIRSQFQQNVLYQLGASVPTDPWKTMDGSYIPMTQTLAGQIFLAAITQNRDIFAHAKSLQEAVNAAEDPASIDIAAGWPAVYQPT